MKGVHELEIYAPIKDFPDYLVTSHGRIMSLKGKQIKEMKQEICQNEKPKHFCGILFFHGNASLP